MSRAATPDPGDFAGRWARYFAERFPPLQHGLLIAGFGFGVQAYAARLATPGQGITAAGLAVACATAFLLILQLRILDEFKDAEDDRRWRPYRPVPRGLVSLAGLRNLWLLCAALESAGALRLAPELLWGLLAIWLYSGLMAAEFFVRDWLKAHALAYMASHIVIVPMIAAYVAACHVLPLAAPWPNLAWLLAASYFAFCVVEVGRKLRAPADEQEGVETYSRLWGLRAGPAAWLAFMAAGDVCALAAAGIGATVALAVILGPLWLASAVAARRFQGAPRPGTGRRFNNLSGVWILALFLGLGGAALY